MKEQRREGRGLLALEVHAELALRAKEGRQAVQSLHSPVEA